jgi:hypothetical protein
MDDCSYNGLKKEISMAGFTKKYNALFALTLSEKPEETKIVVEQPKTRQMGVSGQTTEGQPVKTYCEYKM